MNDVERRINRNHNDLMAVLPNIVVVEKISERSSDSVPETPNTLTVKVIPTLLTKAELEHEIWKVLRDSPAVTGNPGALAAHLVDSLPMIITVEWAGEDPVDKANVG